MIGQETLQTPPNLGGSEEPPSDGRGGYKLSPEEIQNLKDRLARDSLANTEPNPPPEIPTVFDDDGTPY